VRLLLFPHASWKKAQAAAKRLGIEKAYGSYEKLLIDPDIDAVYIPLPNHLHVPWAIKVLNAGKHVLCEKPIALSTAEAQTLLDAAKNFPQLKIMEAFMYRTHPQWQRVKHWISEGRIGKMRMVQTFLPIIIPILMTSEIILRSAVED